MYEPLYKTLYRIRRVEEEIARIYPTDKLKSPVHLSIGQEAVAAAMCAPLHREDIVFGTYRSHAMYLAKGGDLNAMVAEMFGKASGCSRGRGGSMHLFDAENNMLGGHGIVGGHIPLAAGAAFASKYRKDGRVTMCFFGDGSVSIGGFHEAMSLAALWKLPIVFVCENNEYSMGTPLSRTLSVEDVSIKADGYGMAKDRFFARDVLDVEARFAAAIERARTTSEPTLIEVRTYRFRGHSASDPGKYRTAAELEERKKSDPLTRARHELESSGATERLSAIDAEIEKEIEEGLRYADESPEPEVDILEAVTYSGPFAR